MPEKLQLVDISEKALQHKASIDRIIQATSTAIQVDARGMPLADDYVEEIIFRECMQSSLVQTLADKFGFGTIINNMNKTVK
ncbi:hypothetical protein [Vreelandella alkaliphila]|uniref:hypothetical protein n=1 Tax=Vreelandella alkaliphila TaxID=272774 RepID=UPI003F95CEFF